MSFSACRWYIIVIEKSLNHNFDSCQLIFVVVEFYKSHMSDVLNTNDIIRNKIRIIKYKYYKVKKKLSDGLTFNEREFDRFSVK